MTINDLTRQISQLSRDQEYSFCNTNNHNTFKYVRRDNTTHALHFVRIQDGETSQVTVSERNLEKIANKVRAYVPFQIDVIVGASGNWRSLFESALAYTPQFYACKINRQRHLIWAPDHPHDLNTLCNADENLLIVFKKQSRFYDFQYFIDSCYPFDNCYEDFKNGLTDLLRLIRGVDESIFSVYDIADKDKMTDIINRIDSHSYVDFHTPISNNPHFCLYDIAKAYRNFLNAKDYFAFY